MPSLTLPHSNENNHAHTHAQADTAEPHTLGITTNIYSHHRKLLDSRHTFMFACFFAFFFLWFLFKQCLYCECDSFSDCIVVNNLEDDYLSCPSIPFSPWCLFLTLNCVDKVECNSVCACACVCT